MGFPSQLNQKQEGLIMKQTTRNSAVLCLAIALVIVAALPARAQSAATRRLYVATSGGFELNEAAANDALRAGADINWQNGDMGDETMLIMAIKGFKEPNLVKFLLEHGADASLRDRSGKTALEWAHQYNIGKNRNGRDIVALLEAASGQSKPTATAQVSPPPASVRGTIGALPKGSTTIKGAPSAAEIKAMIEQKMTVNYEHHFWGKEANTVSFDWMGPIQVIGTDIRGRIPHKCWNVKLDVNITFEKPSTGERSSARRGIEGNPNREMFCIWREDGGQLDFVTYQP
jgi:hypothetical protein